MHKLFKKLINDDHKKMHEKARQAIIENRKAHETLERKMADSVDTAIIKIKDGLKQVSVEEYSK
jgi:hypothetical protein